MSLSSLSLSWKPFPKERPRARAVNGKAFIYTPPKTKKAEAELQALIREQLDDEFEPTELPIQVEVYCTEDGVDIVVSEYEAGKSKLRGDVDNYAKTVLDAANGVLFKDDRQIQRLTVVKL